MAEALVGPTGLGCGARQGYLLAGTGQRLESCLRPFALSFPGSGAPWPGAGRAESNGQRCLTTSGGLIFAWPMSAAKPVHLFLILILLGAPVAVLGPRTPQCGLGIHPVGTGPVGPVHDGGHCRLSDATGRDASSVAAVAALAGPWTPTVLVVGALVAADALVHPQRVLAVRETNSPVALFIQTRTILL